MAIDTETSW